MMTKTKKLKVSVGNLHNVMRHVCEFKSEDTTLIADKWTALCVTFIFEEILFPKWSMVILLNFLYCNES